MKRVFPHGIFLAALAAAAVAAAGDSALPAGGAIDRDTTWEGRVFVEREVTVGDNATLTIRPGTAVFFREGAGLTVGGVLVAKGNRDAPIRFEPWESAAGRGEWGGIRLRGDGGATVIERCMIRGAAVAVAVSAGSPAVRECDIADGGTGIGVEHKSAPVLSGNLIARMREGGIVCRLGAAPVIERNTLRRCAAGIFAENNSAPLIRGNTVEECGNGLAIHGTVPAVTGNVFRKNGTGAQAVQSGQDQVIRGNRFEGNETGLRCENFSAPVVEENVFTGNGDAVFCFQASNPLVRRNTIAGNRRGIACSRISSPRVSGNEIRDNRIGIHLTLSSYAVIHGNNLFGNEVQVELDDMSSDWERRVRKKPERGAQAQLAQRISRGKASREELSSNTGDMADLMDTVDATGNWWGEEDTQEMEKKGPRANIRRLVDGYDMPVRTYEGYPGEYAKDRVRYDGWKKSRIPDAGAPGAGNGAAG